MISVENFYWCIWENLLNSTGFVNAYYFPFGSRTDPAKWVYGNQPPQRHGRVLHFDQEPIYQNDIFTICDACECNRLRYPSILASSEHSELKREICKDLDVLDWYYFYHGFAALDWYRDSAYIHCDDPIYSKFLCLNHLVDGKRAHRMALVARLVANDLIDSGTVSFHGTSLHCETEIENPLSHLTAYDKQLVRSTLCNNDHLPLTADHNVSSTSSASFGTEEHRLRQKSFLHVVTESVYFDAKLHLTEKIFQPIVTMRPFVLVAAPGNLEYLKSYGFKTFGQWIDEDYDLELDHCKRLDLVTKEIAKICARPVSELRDILADMSETLEFNKRHFYTDFRYTIVSELVDNFDECIKIWNNGRVRYQWPRLPDKDQIKKQLLGHLTS
jgi:hypothetical protein